MKMIHFFLNRLVSICIVFISMPIVNDCSGVCVVLFLVMLSFLVSIQLFVFERRKAINLIIKGYTL